MYFTAALRSLSRLALGAAVFVGGHYVRVSCIGWRNEITLSQAPAKPLIVVLGAMVRRGNSPSEMLQDRLETGLELWRLRGGRFLLSGDGRPGRKDEVRAMRDYLRARGVPAETLCGDAAGYDTYESIARLRNAAPVAPVVIVTQRFHLARALYLARGLGLEVRGLAADRRFYPGLPYYHLREFGARLKAWAQLLTGYHPIASAQPGAPAPARCVALAE